MVDLNVKCNNRVLQELDNKARRVNGKLEQHKRIKANIY